MSVPVKRYQRNQKMGDAASPMLFYLKQEPGSSKVCTIATIARSIESLGALSAEDVTHTMLSFIRELRKSLVEGNKVKVAGLGTFYITFRTKAAATAKECTVKNIDRVHVRFAVDNSLRLANDTIATTRGGENNVQFYIKSEVAAGEGGGDVEDPTV